MVASYEEAEAAMGRWHKHASRHLNASLVAVTGFVASIAVAIVGPLLPAMALILVGVVALVVALVERRRMSTALAEVPPRPNRP